MSKISQNNLTTFTVYVSTNFPLSIKLLDSNNLMNETFISISIFMVIQTVSIMYETKTLTKKLLQMIECKVV